MARPTDRAGDEGAELLDTAMARLGEAQQLMAAAARRLGQLESAAAQPDADARDQAAVLIGGVVAWLNGRLDGSTMATASRGDWQRQVGALARAAQLLGLPLSEV